MKRQRKNALSLRFLRIIQSFRSCHMGRTTLLWAKLWIQKLPCRKGWHGRLKIGIIMKRDYFTSTVTVAVSLFLSVMVIVVLPAFTPFTVIFVPSTATVATFVSAEVAV